MESDFWHHKWRQGETEFNLPSPHRFLREYVRRLSLSPGDTVFVPLCGKSIDMRWLVEQGYKVLGVELSKTAILQFCTEQEIVLSESMDEKGLVHHTNDAYDIVIGDIFNLHKSDLEKVCGVYDRAAFTALPPELRKKYAHFLIESLPAHASMLLITTTFDQTKHAGPPFVVQSEEIFERYGDAFQIENLITKPVTKISPTWKKDGIEEILETAYILKK